jgi:hypothetical protein
MRRKCQPDAIYIATLKRQYAMVWKENAVRCWRINMLQRRSPSSDGQCNIIANKYQVFVCCCCLLLDRWQLSVSRRVAGDAASCSAFPGIGAGISVPLQIQMERAVCNRHVVAGVCSCGAAERAAFH